MQNNSIIYNALRRLKGAYLAKELGFESPKVDFDQYGYTTDSLITEAYQEFYLNEFVPEFKLRVQKLIDLSLAMGAEPVFITQPMAFYQLKKDKVLGTKFVRPDYVTGQPLNGVDSYKLITHLNHAMRDLCDEKYKIVELTSLPIWEQGDFHDWVHNSPQGVKKMANEIWKQLGDHLISDKMN